MEIIVGSTAMKYWLPDFREPTDIDIWSNIQIKNSKGTDYKCLPLQILNLIDYKVIGGKNIAILDSLYTIKCSHLAWSNPKWNKHKNDLLVLKMLKKCKLREELYLALVEYWKTELGTKNFLSLDKNSKDFFTDNIKYIYDHDWLHEQVSYPNKPMYTYCLKDDADVLIDKAKFDLLSFEDKIRMFKEEITVIALERWVVRSELDISWVKAYHLSLEKTVTSLTKGWASEFIILNMEYFVKPEYKYFKNALEVLKIK